MTRILRAFVWMRWRMLVNSLERTGSRDALERFSLAFEKLGPILAGILLIPTALMLAALGGAGGFSLARGETDSLTLVAIRYILLFLPVIAIIGPILLPGDRSNPIRLLLLPISRSTLYVAQSAGAFGDPWIILATPLILFMAAGIAAGGAPLAALVALACAILLLAILIGLTTLVTSAMHLLFRDRRRGELVAMLFIVFIPLVSMVPAMLAEGSSHNRATPSSLPAWVEPASDTLVSLLPAELYVTASRNAISGQLAWSLGGLASLLAMTALIHVVGFAAFRRVLDSPASTGARRTGHMRAAWGRRLPFLSSGASAVALAHVRLALRTPRGRSILLSPLMLFAFFGFMMYRGSGAMDFGPFRFRSGVALAAFSSFFCLLSVVPISMNQFAVDRAGLTMALLSPLTDSELLLGKAVGNAMIGMGPSLFCLIASLALFPGGSPALWATLPLGLVAVYLIVAPVAAIASAVFPKAVDLNTIGSNNAHGLAALMGMVSFVAAAAAPALLAMAAVSWFERPGLAPALVGAWCIVAYGISALLFTLARRIFHSRRENLAMLA
jgi:hypothetical protein